MRVQRIALKILALSVITVVFPALAQQPHPTCNRCPAAYIPKSELDAYTRRAIEHKICSISRFAPSTSEKRR